MDHNLNLAQEGLKQLIAGLGKETVRLAWGMVTDNQQRSEKVVSKTTSTPRSENTVRLAVISSNFGNRRTEEEIRILWDSLGTPALPQNSKPLSAAQIEAAMNCHMRGDNEQSRIREQGAVMNPNIERIVNASPVELLQMDLNIIVSSLEKAQRELEAATGGRQTWLDPIVNIARDRAKQPLPDGTSSVSKDINASSFANKGKANMQIAFSTNNPPFANGNIHFEIARILERAADNFENDLTSFGVFDAAGNRIGTARFDREFVMPTVDGVVIEIDTNDEAFQQHSEEWEIARILRETANHVRESGFNGSLELKSINGNVVGTMMQCPALRNQVDAPQTSARLREPGLDI